MTPSLAALALAAALLTAAGRPGSARLSAVTARLGPVARPTAVRPLVVVVGAVAAGALSWVLTHALAAAVFITAAGLGLGLVVPRLWARPRRPSDDPADLSAAWAQLAVCLDIGLPVAAAVTAAAEPLEGGAGVELRRVAGLLELGADPAEAWYAARGSPALAAFARAAGRSAGTGAALARSARAESTRLQAAVTDAGEARAQRAAVLIAAPLGLCFLPAFIVLGIAPVVVGLAQKTVSWW